MYATWREVFLRYQTFWGNKKLVKTHSEQGAKVGRQEEKKQRA